MLFLPRLLSFEFSEGREILIMENGKHLIMPRLFQRVVLTLGLLTCLTFLIGQSYFAKAAAPSSSSADVTVDFGSRQNTAYPIPANFLGVGGNNIGLAYQTNSQNITQANFRLTRLVSDIILSIFPTEASLTQPGQQVWTKFDQQMTVVANNHLQPIITLAYSPKWLQPQNQTPPQSNPCLTNKVKRDPSRVRPYYIVNGTDEGYQKWGAMAAQVVLHMHKTFPTVPALYEIWNEPDGEAYMCVADSDPNPLQTKLVEYKAIVAAAGHQMRQEAAKDGQPVSIGGPAMQYPLQKVLALWLPGLLDDAATNQYFDFFTYHRYLYGTSFSDLVKHTQDPELGATAEYEQVASAVHAGKQPNAAKTPIYVDEYNMNSCTNQTCRNNATYAPLNNALYIVDFLNSVIDPSSPYGSASSVPAGLSYYAWNLPSQYICLFGEINSSMNCSTNGTLQPYPQYYTYDLFGDPRYMDITNGAYVANSVTVNPAGVYATAFYNNGHDNIVIVNTTGSAFSALQVLSQHLGGSVRIDATQFTLQYKQDPSNPITSQTVTLTMTGSGYQGSLNVPAYTTVALSIAV
jgi:Glycosyl hydrolases family 39